MSRLTDKDKTYMNNTMTKLQVIENIEEELGIDLITLFKALTNGLYGKFYLENGEPNIIFNSNKFNFIDKEHKCFDSYFSPHPTHLYFKDYGKTWALTKEELLCNSK